MKMGKTSLSSPRLMDISTQKIENASTLTTIIGFQKYKYKNIIYLST